MHLRNQKFNSATGRSRDREQESDDNGGPDSERGVVEDRNPREEM